MGIFLGRIDIRNSYYNFTPMYECIDGELKQLNDSDLERIIPKSAKRNINFSYSIYSRDAQEIMYSTFFEDVPIVFEFETEDLEINYDRDNRLNPTGYKIRTLDFYDEGKIRSAASIGCFLLLEEDDVVGNPLTSNILEIGTELLSNETKVMIRLKKNGMLLGPFDISYRSIDQTFVISTRPEENKYILSGYDSNECEFIHLNLERKDVLYVKPNKNANIKQIDIITDKALLEAFKSEIKDDLLVDGKLDLNQIDDAVSIFADSQFMVADVVIRRNRLQRIKEMLSVSADVEDSVSYISEVLGSELGLLITKYDDKKSSESLINVLLEQNPEILNKLPDYHFAKSKISELQDQEKNLLEEIGKYKTDLENEKQINLSDIRDIKELDEIRIEIDEAKQRRESLLNEIIELEELNEQHKEFESLAEGVNSLKKENDYLEMRKAQLSRETTELGSRLSEVSINIEKKLSETPIDGLVANLLMESSSSWKAKQEKDRYLDIIEKYDEIQTVDMKPQEMVEYMYDRVREVRPVYDKNTVTNICTCIFQNFLTVFSGDPGCGKTSICNIIGQALGLEKLGDLISHDAIRYIPVSVERGWTSKRDFIGYYNPLTKSFDRNNKRVFEALNIVDLEEKKHICSLPMIILLDEANLSPMEYYWADFMNVCDDLSASNEINIGESAVLNVSDTLRFVATINNDHTTESLSPRLIDRAAVITLPKVSLRDYKLTMQSGSIDKENIEIVSWNTIKNTYIDNFGKEIALSATARKIYDEIFKPHLREQHIYISPRTELSLIKYCAVASNLFDRNADSAKRDPNIIALDYAVSQKILPKINGYGDEYLSWLKVLMKKCEDNYLIRSKEIIADIIEKGNANMSYYQFFA